MSTSPSAGPYLDDEIRQRIERCPKLASLQSINRKLAGLVNSEQSYTSQIAEIIRRDPSLTSRLLRMVNSVYFGLSAKVNNIEEAVLYLGLRQIRELSMATPVIEDMEKISPSALKLPWREMWQHSIGTAIMTREILATTNLLVDDDTDYIIGLLHNVGKVVLATAWPHEFERIVGLNHQDPEAVCAVERELVGWDHAAIGGYYLEKHQLAPEIVEAIRNHAHPSLAGDHRIFAAAVQVADLVVRKAGIASGFERLPEMEAGAWMQVEGWGILFNENEREASLAQAAIENTMARLPSMLSGMV
ncbi:MAG: HDOD domain-containing protein [Verrucomicrobia bacterium]|nr:HDOD domain-containing protein [Verrucomicrobiota bacterium]